MSTPQPAAAHPERSSAVDGAVRALSRLLGERVSTKAGVLATHGRDESWHHPHSPDIVAFPRTTEEVAAIARICHERRLPIVPFGLGSSVEGALIPVHGGVVIDLSGLDQLVAVHPENFDCVVQAGVHRRKLNEMLKDTGLFFSVDPGADATIGGMVSTRASGTNTVRYGTMADVVRALQVVLADGRIIRTGTRARKSAAGYDLTHLFMGSEGTLGIVTEVTLRLYPHPEQIVSGTCRFPDVASAVNFAVGTIQYGVPVARLELLDELTIEVVNRYSKLDMPLAPHLFFEVHGSAAQAEATVRLLQELATDHGGRDMHTTTDMHERERLWHARHDVAYACSAWAQPRRLMTTDVCVPLDQLTGCVEYARTEARNAGITAPVLGHVGDGNFHMSMMIDPDSAEEVRRAEKVNRRLVRRAIACGGTCTGEHGVGLGKREFMNGEHGPAIDVMRHIKAALDPLNLMNPGKVLPEVESPSPEAKAA